MRIIQIAVSAGTETLPDIVYALTEDGQLYAMSTSTEKWREVPLPVNPNPHESK
jgi:hypothetical protein